MTIAREGTFDYVFEVRGTPVVRLEGRPVAPLGFLEKRLLGHSPVLEASDYSPQPWQVYARVVLTAQDVRTARAKALSFSVERGMVRVLRPGDRLYIHRTLSAGLGLSILRGNTLIAAAGAIIGLPLGDDVSLSYPRDLIDAVHAIVRRRDPEYCLHEHPVQVTIGGVTRILHRGAQLGHYEVRVRHGYLSGLPGRDASISIERRGMCPATAAHTTAQLLDEGDPAMPMTLE